MDRFDYITYEMKIENKKLLQESKILNQRLFRTRERHGFLKSINRAQYDPKLELYVSLDSLCISSDEEFAVKVAKSSYEEFEKHLKSL